MVVLQPFVRADWLARGSGYVSTDSRSDLQLVSQGHWVQTSYIYGNKEKLSEGGERGKYRMGERE